MKTVPIHELKANLAHWINAAEAGEEIVITRHNEPVAKISPVAHPKVHVGARVGQGKIEPLPGVRVPPGTVMALLDEDRGDR